MPDHGVRHLVRAVRVRPRSGRSNASPLQPVPRGRQRRRQLRDQRRPPDARPRAASRCRRAAWVIDSDLMPRARPRSRPSSAPGPGGSSSTGSDLRRHRRRDRRRRRRRGRRTPPTGLASTGIDDLGPLDLPRRDQPPGGAPQIAIFSPSSRTAEIDLVLTYEDHRSNRPISLTLTGVGNGWVDLRSVPGLRARRAVHVRLESLALDGNARCRWSPSRSSPTPRSRSPSRSRRRAPPGEEEEGEGEAQEAPPRRPRPGRRSSTGSPVVGGSDHGAHGW